MTMKFRRFRPVHSRSLNWRVAVCYLGKVREFVVQSFGAALYLGGIMLSILATDALTIPVIEEISLGQAVSSELALCTPAFLMLMVQSIRWFYLPYCVLLGCATGILGIAPNAVCLIGLVLMRLILLVFPEQHSKRYFRLIGLIGIAALFKYFALRSLS